MQFNVFDWDEVDQSSPLEFTGGRVRAKATQSVAWFVECEGFETLATVATELDLRIASPVRVRVEGPEAVRVYAYKPYLPVYEPRGEKFTNADRKPHESGAMLEVKRALRELELKQRQFMADQRAAAKADAPQPDPGPDPGSDQEPELDPVADEEAEADAGPDQ